MQVKDVAADLVGEQQALDDVVADIDEDAWATLTPSPRWTVADQISHLSYFDGTAVEAIENPEAFRAGVIALWETASGGDAAFDELTLGAYRAGTTEDLLATWRHNRTRLGNAAKALTEESRVDWYGPSMGAKSFLTARLMECWAHGQDVVDALDADRQPTDRLAHIARLGFITRGWTYQNRGLELPEVPIRVELSAPSGGTWTHGPDDADESVIGDAEEFCLVVVQRRHLDDTDLVTTPSGRE